jgi:hypothetical protein
LRAFCDHSLSISIINLQAPKMKINTKDKSTTTPLRKKQYSHSYYHENKFIPGASVGDFNDSDDEPAVGRIVRYETILVTTPILTSSRTQKKTKSGSSMASSKGRSKRLNKDDVDELSSRLEALYIRDTLGESHQANHMSGKSEGKKPEPPTTFLGRCSLVIYNSATQGFIEVIRSARLAFKSF